MEQTNKLENKIDKLDERLDRIIENKDSLINQLDLKLDKLDERLNNVDKIMIKQEANLELHMRRSDNLERLVQLQEERVAPIEKHLIGINFMLKVIAGTLAAAGTIVAILESLNLLQ